MTRGSHLLGTAPAEALPTHSRGSGRDRRAGQEPGGTDPAQPAWAAQRAQQAWAGIVGHRRLPWKAAGRQEQLGCVCIQAEAALAAQQAGGHGRLYCVWPVTPAGRSSLHLFGRSKDEKHAFCVR